MPIKILAIDDDLALTDLLATLLQSHGFDVIATTDTETGIEKIRTENPDIVLLDLMMPKLDGWKACVAIRAFSDIPIIVLSALDNPSMITSALDAGADDYLVKPVSSSVLIAHINNLTRRANAKKNGSRLNSTLPAPGLNPLSASAGWE